MELNQRHAISLLLMLLSHAVYSTGQTCPCQETTESDLKFFLCECRRSWQEAQDYCSLAFSAALARPSNDTLQTQLASRLKANTFGDTWIGGKGTRTEWHWAVSLQPLLGQGCYRDDPLIPDLDSLMSLTHVTPSSCINECRSFGYLYAGVQAGFQCFCGDLFGSYGTSTACSLTCSADPNVSCGGYSANYIYAVFGSNFNNWAFYEPSSSAYDDKECVMLSCITNQWTWRADVCNRRKKSLCHVSVVNGSCPRSGMRRINNDCFHVEETVFSTWFEAQVGCMALGGQLYEDNNKTLHDLMVMQVLSCYMDSLWIGGTKIHWRWSNGDSMSFYQWATGRPSTEGDKCIALSHRLSNTFEWSDISCNQPLMFVCQKDLTTTTTTVSTTSLRTTTTTSTNTFGSATMYLTESLPTREEDSTSTRSASSVVSWPGSVSTSVRFTTSATSSVLEPTTSPTGVDMLNEPEEWIGLGVGLGILLLLALLISCCICTKRKKTFKGKKNGNLENGVIATNPFVKDTTDFAYINSKTSMSQPGGEQPIDNCSVLSIHNVQENMVAPQHHTKTEECEPHILRETSSNVVGSTPLASLSIGNGTMSFANDQLPTATSTTAMGLLRSDSPTKRDVPNLCSWPTDPAVPTGEQPGYIRDLNDLNVQYIDPIMEVTVMNYKTGSHAPKNTDQTRPKTELENCNNSNNGQLQCLESMDLRATDQEATCDSIPNAMHTSTENTHSKGFNENTVFTRL